MAVRGACLAVGLTAALALAGPASAPAAPNPPPAAQSPPAIDQAPQVGVDDSCDPGTWSTTSGGNVDDTDYTWFRDSTATAIFESHDGTVNDYTPVVADLGHRLICRETVTDSADGVIASADSSPSNPVTPTATVTLTRYLPAVSGSIGEAVGGVTVALGLVRPSGDGSTSSTVARTTATTAPDGSWSATLAPAPGAPLEAFGAPGDELTTAYAAPAGSPGTLVPGSLTYTDDGSFGLGAGLFAGDGSAIAGDGSAISDADITGPDCSSLQFLVNGSAVASAAADGDPCTAGPGTLITDGDHVQAAVTGPFTDGTTTATLTTISDVGLLGTGATGAPSCTADLVTADVACTNLSAAAFTVSRDGGPPVPLVTSPLYAGAAVDGGDATLPGLSAGDLVTLREAGASAGRALSILHIAALRIDLDPSGGESGMCDPGKEFTGGAVCPPSGSFDAGLGADTALVDDLSGGGTQVSVPVLSIVSPADGTLVPSGGFPAVAGVSGNGTTAQTDVQALAETAGVTLEFTRQGSSTPGVTRSLALDAGSQGPEAVAQLSGVPPGGYDASWMLTDVHGDSTAVTDTFGVHPGAAIVNSGSSPVLGHRRVPRWLASLAHCLARHAGVRVRRHSGCTTTVSAPRNATVSLRLAHSASVFASGEARVHHAVARIRLRLLRRLAPGRYRLVARFRAGRRSSTRRWALAI